jgi:hypothetical protein
MVLLPVLGISLWIFIVGLVNDWRADADETRAGGFSLARLLIPRASPGTGEAPAADSAAPAELYPAGAPAEPPSLRATTR